MLRVLLSCSDVCLGSSLVVAWCYCLVVMRSYSLFTLREPLELRKGTQSSTTVLVMPPLKLQQGAWVSFELRQGTQGFLELPQGSRISRSVETGKTWIHAIDAGESGLILGRWGTYCPFHLRQVTRGSSRVTAVDPGLLLSCGRYLVFLWITTQISSQVAMKRPS